MGNGLLALLVPLLLLGCAGATTSSDDVQHHASPSPTIARPSAVPTATRSAPDFEGYAYALPWPEDQLVTQWRPATQMWDGMARIDHGNTYTDSVRTMDGDVFAFGYPTTGPAEDLQQLVARQANEWHGCDEQPGDEQPLDGGGEPGIMAVHQCGATTVLRWFGVHDGLGLALLMIVDADADQALARSHFEEYVSKLAWERKDGNS
jgi:hypothetical protein